MFCSSSSPPKKTARFEWKHFCATAGALEPAPELRLLAPEGLPAVDLLAHQRAQKELRFLGSLEKMLHILVEKGGYKWKGGDVGKWSAQKLL